MDAQELARNAESLDRLRALIDRLSDEELGQGLGDGWTVSAALAHLAFWDRRITILIARAQQGVFTPSPADFDVINDAMKPAWIALQTRAAAAECLAAAEACDAAVANLDADLAARLAALPDVRLGRHRHRATHLAEIEAALG